jgi:hypothetical protein
MAERSRPSITSTLAQLASPIRVIRTRAHRHVDPATARDVAACFLAARTSRSSRLICTAYRQLQVQTDQQYAVLTDPRGPYRLTVVYTRDRDPYGSDEQLIDSARATRVLEVTTAAVDRDRRHPLLGCDLGGAYDRFRAVHDLLGHVATGYGFDRNGEYSAWLTQRRLYRGLARWAAATELHGENSVLWTTQQLAEHKAVLLDPELLTRPPLELLPTGHP